MEVLMRRSGILMFSWEDDVTDVTGMDKNRIAEQDFQNTHDTLVMRKGVEKPKFLNINVETSESFGSVLFADEDTFSTDTGIGMGVWFKKLVLMCHTEHRLT
jgi:hypothetical protein